MPPRHQNEGHASPSMPQFTPFHSPPEEEEEEAPIYHLTRTRGQIRRSNLVEERSIHDQLPTGDTLRVKETGAATETVKRVAMVEHTSISISKRQGRHRGGGAFLLPSQEELDDDEGERGGAEVEMPRGRRVVFEDAPVTAAGGGGWRGRYQVRVEEEEEEEEPEEEEEEEEGAAAGLSTAAVAGIGREKKKAPTKPNERQLPLPVATVSRKRAVATMPKSITRGRPPGRPRRRGAYARGDGWKLYIFKVLKQVHPDMSISQKGMDTMANFTADMFFKLASRAGQLVRDVSKRKTLTAREVQTAVKLEIRGDLSEHAVSEGSKAVARYYQQMKS